MHIPLLLLLHEIAIRQTPLCYSPVYMYTYNGIPFLPSPDGFLTVVMAFWIAKLAALLAWVSSSCSSPILPFAPRAVVVNDASQLKPEYDYVVVGGGTSGLVVANRLTEDPSSTSFTDQYVGCDSDQMPWCQSMSL